jgi:hypothetical protein
LNHIWHWMVVKTAFSGIGNFSSKVLVCYDPEVG